MGIPHMIFKVHICKNDGSTQVKLLDSFEKAKLMVNCINNSAACRRDINAKFATLEQLPYIAYNKIQIPRRGM